MFVCHGGVWGELRPKDSLNIQLPLHSAPIAETFLNDDGKYNENIKKKKVFCKTFHWLFVCVSCDFTCGHFSLVQEMMGWWISSFKKDLDSNS